MVCPTGYFLDNNSNCSSCLPHCQFCSDQNTCTSCFRNFNLNGDNTICSETINVTCPQNCTICSDNQTCDICKIDCFLNLCSPCPSNCVSFSDSNTCLSCLSCISNNSLLNGTCVPVDLTEILPVKVTCPQFCSACINLVCTWCIEGHFLSSSKECLACPQTVFHAPTLHFATALKQLQYLNLQSIRPKSGSVYGTCGQLFFKL